MTVYAVLIEFDVELESSCFPNSRLDSIFLSNAEALKRAMEIENGINLNDEVSSIKNLYELGNKDGHSVFFYSKVISYDLKTAE